MSSIWNSAVSPAGNSPFASTGVAPKPGGGAAAHFQSLISSKTSSQQPGQPSAQLGLSPGTTAETGQKMGTAATASSATAGSNAAGTSGSSAITSNDFLTLLVTEMQNQDPTAQTDPNAYVDQLVQINSLEQLISMNQNLALVLGTVTSPVPTGGSVAGTGSAAAASVGAVSPASSLSHSGSIAGGSAQIEGSRSSTRNNLSAASHVVAHALDGHPVAAQRGHALRDIARH